LNKPGRRRRHLDILSILLEKANVQGYITTDDLIEVYPDVSRDAERLEAVLVALRRRGVDILDDEEPPSEEEDVEPFEGVLIEMDGGSTIDGALCNDIIGLYLKEMSRVALLNVDEELSLARRIETGREAKRELLALPRGSNPAYRRKLRIAISDGQAAREHLIKANTRLVVSIAIRYTRRGVPFLDLIQEGILGLMKAVEKF